MECYVLPLERFDELGSLFDMKSFREKRFENLKTLREICVVAEEDGKLVGEINIMTENANIPAAVIPNKRIYLFGLRVLPEYRRMGIGTALVAFAVNTAVERGIFEFTIGVEKGNEQAKRLYAKLGRLCH